jgi:hypothetical protein
LKLTPFHGYDRRNGEGDNMLIQTKIQIGKETYEFDEECHVPKAREMHRDSLWAPGNARPQ